MKRIIETVRLSIAGFIENGENSKVFKTIWELYYKEITSYCKYRFRFEDPEDIASEICLKAYNKISLYNSEYSFRAWIFSIARNYCLDCLRSKKIELYENSEPIADTNRSIDKELMKNEIDNIIDNILEKEPNNKKEVYFLYYFADLKIREISELLKIPEGTIKYILYDLRKKLKPILEDYYDK